MSAMTTTQVALVGAIGVGATRGCHHTERAADRGAPAPCVRRAVEDVPGIELGCAREVDLKGVRDSPDLYPVLMPC